MQRYILNRVAQAAITIVGISMVVFMLIHLSGDPLSLFLPLEATQEDWDNMRRYLGLDQPLHVQYWRFFSRAVQGDFGESIRWSRPTIKIFLHRFPNTLQLGVAAMVWALAIGLSIGILSAVRAGSWFDSVGKILALLGQATPVFWLGLMLILVFSVYLGWLPTSGMGGFKKLIMPSFTLGASAAAAITRLTRSTMLDVLDTEYIRMARIKGVPEMFVITKHAFKNAMIPVVTVVALNLIFLINGTVITETIFNWPGVGRLVVDSILARDYPVVQTCLLLASFMYVFANLFVDILYAYLDPRIRYQ